MNPAARWHSLEIAVGAVTAYAVSVILSHPITQAAGVVAPVIVVAPGGLDGPTTETTPAGTVILRGSGGPKPVATEPVPERVPVHYPSTPPPVPAQGFDNNFDTGGIDRGFDGTGLTR